MIAILGFILALALAIALAPFILGFIGTMLALLLTAFLYVLAGCPKHAEPPKRDAAADRNIEQIEAWLEEDRQHEDDAAKRPRSRRHAR